MKVNHLLFITLLILLPVVIFSQENSGLSHDRLQRLDQYFTGLYETGELAGGVGLISRNGEIAYSFDFGVSDLETGKPMQEDNIFFIQSMTKPIISVALMTLYEQGLFALNDPISKYLPQFSNMRVAASFEDVNTSAPVQTPITIKHCLTHTAGFLHGLGQSMLDQVYAKALYGMGEISIDSITNQPHNTIEDRVNTLAKLPLAVEPGTKWYYSASPDILALLIEYFSKRPVNEYLKEVLFDPLEMHDTRYNLSAEQEQRMTKVGLQQEGKISVLEDQTPTSGNTVFGGTHGLFSTPGDYMKFCQFLLNDGQYNGHQILGKKTIELIRADHVNTKRDSPGEGFGLGFGVRNDLTEPATLGSVGQYSWGGLFNTYFFIDPKENLCAVLMMQFYPYMDFYNLKFRQLVYQAIVD